ncbi:sensor histidine kinase [Lederbergia galactosidilytica]|uniref:histidine kinase n=1 Tax=Lederbergia galactosidilytica TaxID=217031 RepID=A0A177ZH95_9BACI|nr:sensor histidine kinase [Lederbergia galactosidilytica]KRG15357.1 histidine kinase [Virgibacillus soli]OAK67185.1 histidine kinase [Lederbergia galactosidilytica]
MKKIIQKLKSSGISPYIWTILAILPFYFVLQSSAIVDVVMGITLIIVFFVALRFAYVSKKWPVHLWTIILIAISMTMSLLFQYIYFAFYIAYCIGHIKNRATFLTLYIIHLLFTAISITLLTIYHNDSFLQELPFIIILCLSVILLPINIYNRKRQEKLEQQLEYANNKIAELVKQEERQRIARDLHDTLGQKLSMIGLKSDLARKLIYKRPEQAKHELKDIQQTARTALNEVRTMVSQMRGIRLQEELVRVREILHVAQIDLLVDHDVELKNVSIFLENILSMCVKEAVNNVVKHSQAKTCWVMVEQSDKEIEITVEDDGVGMSDHRYFARGNGLMGIKERLEFVNGTLDITEGKGTILKMRVPTVIKKVKEENI